MGRHGSLAVTRAIVAGALVALAVVAERRGHEPWPWLDLVTGCVLLLCGLVAATHPGTRVPGAALLGAGISWFVATAGSAGPFADVLPQLHRGLIVGAVLVASGRTGMIARGAAITLAVVGSTGTRAFSTPWLLLTAVMALCVLAFDAHRAPSQQRFAVTAGIGIALWTIALTWLRPYGLLDPVERSTIYGIGLSLAAVAVASRDRLSTALATTDVVRDAGTSDVRIGFRDDPGEVFRDITGRPIDVPGPDGLIVVPGATGDTVIVHSGVVAIRGRTRARLVEAARMLRAHHDALIAERRQAELIADSERRIRAADDVAAVEVAAELERLVVAPIERARDVLDGDRSDHAEAWRRALTEIIDEVRTAARGIEPPELAQGLAPALESLAARTTAPVQVEVVAAPSDPAATAALYFVASEAVTNAVRHGAPRAISIRVSDEGDAATLTVSDDGSGGATDTGAGGLAGLRRRLAQLGGTLDVTERGGGGTVVTARLPHALLRQPTLVNSNSPSPATS